MLTFDEKLHQYTVDGRVLPSVTSILSPLMNFSGIDPAVLERARRLGTAVHTLTELHDKDDLDMDTLPPELAPYLSAWQRFRAECDFVPDTIECRLHHPGLAFAGTSDRTGVVRGARAVIDIKKMATLGPVIGLQLAAYREMHNLLGHAITHRYALGLRVDGTYRLEPYTDPTDFAVFVSLLNIKNWRIKHGQ